MPKYKNTKPVPTAGVIAVLKTPAISQAISRGFSISKIVQLAKENDALLFDNETNQYVAFSHEVLHGDNIGPVKNSIIKLELVDVHCPKTDSF